MATIYNMHYIDKILLGFIGGGSIIFGVSMHYLPSLGGTIPQGMNLDTFIKEQNSALVNSEAFKWTIVGASTMFLSSATIVLRAWREDSSILPLNS